MKKNIFAIFIIFFCLISVLTGCELSPKHVDPQDLEVIKINESINTLENIEDDEAKLLKIIEIKREVNAIYDKKIDDVKMKDLERQEKNTVTNLKRVLGGDECIESSEESCSLIESIINVNDIKGIDIHKHRFSSEMWTCNNEMFYRDLLSLFNLPYVDMENNFTDEFALALNNYNDYYNFTIYLSSNKLCEIGVFNNGYVKIQTKGMIEEYQQYGLKDCFISIIRLDVDSLYRLVEEENLAKYNANVSIVSLLTSIYNNGMSSAYGPALIFNLDGATFECKIDCGSFEYYKKTASLIVKSGEKVQWAPSYVEVHDAQQITLVEEVKANGKAYMDVIIKLEDKNIGYIVLTMIPLDNSSYQISILESVLFTYDDNKYQEVSTEFILQRIAKIKGK